MSTRVEFWPCSVTSQAVEVADIGWPYIWQEVDHVPRKGELVFIEQRRFVVDKVGWGAEGTVASIQLRLVPDDPWVTEV